MTRVLHVSKELSREARLPLSSVRAAEPRLWAKVDKNGPIIEAIGTPCWLWLGYTKNGYGSLSVCDYDVYAHRLAFFLEHGCWPSENACHRCDVKSCVRPSHLWNGPQTENIADMRAKGRAVEPPVRRGMANPQATLTDEDVAEVRRRVAAGDKQRDVAADFGVSQATVWRMAHRRVRA